MNKIGISIYPNKDNKQATLEYIDLANQNGVTRVFANLLEITADGGELEILKECLTQAKSLGMEVIVDVNPSIYKELNLKYTEFKFFQELGATGIRLDEDFKGEIESQLSQNILLELNASSGTETMEATLKKGGKTKNLIACHNFYPMEYTGLKFSRFVELSKWYKDKGIRVAAFITLPRDQEGTFGPWDINDGMPTLEEHRNATLSQQIRHFLSMGIIDDIIISQQGTTEKQFKEIKRIIEFRNEKLELKDINPFGVTQEKFKEFSSRNDEAPQTILEVEDLQKVSKVEEFIAFKYLHVNRVDITDYFIRSTYSRVTFVNQIIKAINYKNRKIWNPGDVVVLNEKYGRYAGELHIVTKEMPYSGKRNYIGKITNFDRQMLGYIKGGQRFKLIKKEK